MDITYSLKYKRNPTNIPKNSQISLLLHFPKALISSKLSTYILNSLANLMQRHVCLFIFLCVQEYMHTCRQARRGQKTVLRGHTDFFLVSHWHGTCQVGWLARKPLDLPDSTSPSARLTHTPPGLFLTWTLESKMRSSCLQDIFNIYKKQTYM